MTKVWVFSEQAGEEPTPHSLELLTKARNLGDVAVIYVGTEATTTQLGTYGASKVHRLEPSEVLYPAPLAAALADLVANEQPDLILFGQAYNDRDVAGRLAARLGRTVLSNAIDVSVEGGKVTTTHEIFGGSQKVTAEFTGETPHIVIVRPKSFAAEAGGGSDPVVVEIALPEPGRTTARVTGTHEQKREGPQLEEAKVIITGGRGLGGAEHYGLVEKLGALLGAATGATRAIVDAGWVPYSKQVGQTGKTVKPEVYIACGVSGAMQHLVGMKDSKAIIAINKDPDAPIFSIADLGVVGDVHKVLPKLIDALEAR